jgi:hypothetical protein
VAGEGVAAAAHRGVQLLLAGEAHRERDVVGPAQRATSAGCRSMLPFQTRLASS